MWSFSAVRTCWRWCTSLAIAALPKTTARTAESTSATSIVELLSLGFGKHLSEQTILVYRDTLPREPKLKPREDAVRDLKLQLRHFVVELLVSNFEALEE